ncbi:hypothetical protein LOTGIDRAFT_132347 [Lottia gigantea]|uniref:Endoglucanase n=1 Tax=Lottia gigantea TaxID=225164 RepID=V3ZPH5_LOTGI|nr:hypothetical protein LOTGIDRAFT_132347 [Lottia gigantea]ESO84370.1 hypothetical protein LOTGIDRAFT_132347 [Lottia gigantea]
MITLWVLYLVVITAASAATTVNSQTVTGSGTATTAAVEKLLKVTVSNHWSGGFQGEFCIQITQELSSWRAHLTFDQPLNTLEVWVADLAETKQGGKEFILVNKPWNSVEHIGDKLCVTFIGHGQGDIQPTATVYIEGMTAAVITRQTFGPDYTGTSKSKYEYYVSATQNCTKYNYDDILRKSILFYEAQRSGKLPGNNRIPWRGDSGLEDGSDVGLDLTGGWYDAGDHVKFGFPMAYSTAILTMGLLQWKDAYQTSRQLDHMYSCIKWPLDYFIKAHNNTNELYVQVGDGKADHNFWGRPEDMDMARPSYKIDASHPGSDVAGETCAAFAAGYLAFKDKDPKYAATLKQHATELYEFGMKYQGVYTDTITAAVGFYKSGNTTDELCWSALWMYMITNETKYLTEAEKLFQPGPAWGLSWDDTTPLNQVLLYKLTKKDIYKQAVIDTMADWMPGGSVPYTPKGLAWRSQWGSLRYSANMAMVALMAAEVGINEKKYRDWAMGQIHYALGDTGFSYVIGVGDKYPTHPHHRAASCPWPPAPCSPEEVNRPEPSTHTLYGGLVGGPGKNDEYKDVRDNYVSNEVATDYNAGFQSAVAGRLIIQ